MSPDAGGAGATDSGGSGATAGVEASGGSSAGGSKANAGASQGGKAAGGAGTATGGKAGASGSGGKAGSNAGGSAPQAGQTGQAGQGGMAGTATAGGGAGGTVVTPPEPVTVETTDIDDTQVASCFQNVNYGEAVSMNVDGDGGCRYEILIIAPLTDIPEGALVSDATLTLNCTNVGDPITVSYVNEAWKELTVRWSSRPEVGATLGTLKCEALGKVTINLTAAVKAWLAGDHDAYGIYLRTETTDGTDFDTSEAASAASRPKFSVTYTLPAK